MDTTEHKQPTLISIYQFVFRALKRNPVIGLPFAVFFAFEACALLIIYLIPRAPFDSILAPFVVTFWGEKFLHYPAHFLLFPMLDYRAKLAISIIYGPLMAAWATLLINELYNRTTIDKRAAFIASLQKYIVTFTVIILINIGVYCVSKGMAIGLRTYFNAGHTTLLQIGQSLWRGPLLALINFALVIAAQSLFAFTIPLVVLHRKKVTAAFAKSAILCKRYLFLVLFLVTMPKLLEIPILLLLYKTPVLVYKIWPESVALVCGIGALVNTLIIDLMITVSITYLYLEICAKENARCE
jgi:hypothetical protein